MKYKQVHNTFKKFVLCAPLHNPSNIHFKIWPKINTE